MKKLLLSLFAFFFLSLSGAATRAGSTGGYASLASNEKALLSFSFLKANNTNLPSDVSQTGTIESYNVITLPAGTNVSSLKPTFTISAGAKITVNGAAQTSGVSTVNFSTPVVYRITAEDGSTRDYTIEVSMQVDIATLDNTVNNFMTKYSVPGLSIAILKGERLVYAKGYGVANQATGEPVTTNSLFRVASVSKSITARAALKLVDEGKLNLDQKVFGTGSILGTKYGTQPYTPQLEQITVRQLLNHTAGGDVWTNVWDIPNNKLDPFYQKEWLSYTTDQVISATLDTRPVTQTPGTKFVYSNIGINIAGRVIEKISGIAYDKYVQDNLLKPIGIDPNTMKIGSSTLAERFPNEVVYYNPYPGYDQPYDFPVPRFDAHGGWITTPINMARLLAFTDGVPGKKDILSASSIQDMITPSATSLAGGAAYGYGLGEYVSTATKATTHDGSMAGTSTTWWQYPNGYTYVVFTNTRRNETSYVPELEGFLYTALFSGTPLAYTLLMKGDQFDTYYGRSEPSGYCSPTQNSLYSCSSSDGTIGIEAFKIWSAGKTSVLLDTKGVCSQNGNAYSDFTTTRPAIKLTAGASFPFQVEAMRVQSGASKDKLFINPVSIWVDLDQNKVFTDDERVYYTTSVQSYPNPLLDNQFTLPATAKPGLTRMRIRLGTAFTNKPETPCEQIDGETEDYLVDIGTNCPTPVSVSLTASNATICQGSSTTLTGSAVGGQGILTFSWQRDNATLNETGSVLPVSIAGVYRFTATDASGCSGSASLTTSTAPSPTANVGISTTLTGTELYKTDSFTTATGGTPPYTYQWRTTPLAVAVTNPGIANPAFGPFTTNTTITLVVGDAKGCSSTSQATVTYIPCSLTAAFTGNPFLCGGASTLLTATATNAAGSLAYEWKKGNAVVGTSAGLTVSATDTYSLRITDAKGCTASNSFSVSAITLPDAKITALPGGTDLLPNGTVSLSANTGTGLTYQWRLGGTAIAGATASVYQAQQAGQYTVSVGKDGCVNTSPSVTVNLITATEPVVADLRLTLYPNPSAGRSTVILTVEKASLATLSLMDATGRSLQTWLLPTRQIRHEIAVDFGPLAPGIYLLKAEAGDQQIVKKVVKE
ncbi:MAG: serine hydrolase [Spirosoma sp.]|nr:serine hydrolase [Spirosoma sp.]